MAVLRSALFVDFDNIFNRLHDHDPEAAHAFGGSPGPWLQRLAAHRQPDGKERRFLQTRVYTDPNGRVDHGDLVRHRRSLVDAGFEVIACSPPHGATAGACGTQMIVDAMLLLQHDAPIDELLITAGDADLTPLLRVFRAAGRRTGVISAAVTGPEYRNVADLFVGLDPFLELIGRGHRAAQSTASSIIRTEMAAASKAIRLSALGHTIRETIGDMASSTGWFGYGTMRDFIDSLEDENLATNPGFVWDITRHAPPLDPTAGLTEDDLPAPIAAIRIGADLPLLASPTWPLLFEQIAAYGRRGARPLTLTECTITVRNGLEDADPLASRSVVNSVLHRIQNAGLPLDRDPPPDATELQATFKASIVAEYVAAGREMTDGLDRALDRWLKGENGTST